MRLMYETAKKKFYPENQSGQREASRAAKAQTIAAAKEAKAEK
jgi:hypothetical protein